MEYSLLKLQLHGSGENTLLSNTASSFIKNTGGYYLALNDDEAEYGDLLLQKNKENGIPTKELDIVIAAMVWFLYDIVAYGLALTLPTILKIQKSYQK